MSPSTLFIFVILTRHVTRSRFLRMLVVTVRGEIPAGVNYLELMLESSKADWAHEEHGYTTLLSDAEA